MSALFSAQTRAARVAPFAAAATLAIVALAPLDASAYCRTASCPNRVIGALCVPEASSDCGIPLFWPGGCAGYSLQADASSQVSIETLTTIAERAFAAWTNADCGGARPGFSLVTQGRVACDEPEYQPAGANANVILFRDDDWPYAATNVLALTTVTFNLDTGEIRDADMEINSQHNMLSTSDTDVSFDLLSVVTHEAGHFLGLSHSADRDATMVTDYPPMSLTLRDLAPDDVAGMCAIYPPGDVSACDPTPRNGLGDACGTEAVSPDGADSESCSCTVGDRSPNDAAWLAVVGGVVSLVVRGRRARRHRPSPTR